MKPVVTGEPIPNVLEEMNKPVFSIVPAGAAPAGAPPVAEFSYQACFAQLSACRRLLEDIGLALRCQRITHQAAAFDFILEFVAFEFEIPSEVILSRDRTDRTSVARHVAIFLISENVPGVRQCEIAKWFKRDHASIPNALENVRERCSIDQVLARRVRTLQSKIRLMMADSGVLK